MDYYYSSERNVQILLGLFRAYGIHKVIASPGAINIPVVASMQQDSFFEMYSCVDERSAAYMAVGLAEEAGVPVVLSCTGATASRNYMPGLTEAFYRKLPVIALTSSRDVSRIGHLFPQVTDRTSLPNDIATDSVWIQTIKDTQDEWDVSIKLNRVLNSLKNGPVHINITDAVSRDYLVKQLPPVRTIPTITPKDSFPYFPQGKIAVFVGEHKKWNKEQTTTLDAFCSTHDAVVLCDHTSKYHGEYRVLFSLIGSQEGTQSPLIQFDLIIHIGEVSGAYDIFARIHPKQVWRVCEDGAYRDLFQRLTYVFKMSETEFFEHYTARNPPKQKKLLLAYNKEYESIYNRLPSFPFSNLYIGKTIGNLFPNNSTLYLGILNTLRTWNYFEINPTVNTYSNVGGFGIDGTMSTIIGASLAAPNKLFFAVLGDLAFFYDMNCLGNRHVKNNVRILIINNGKGVEFRNPNHQASFMEEAADAFVAAAGHWGVQSRSLVRHFATDLGFEYLCATSKEEFKNVYHKFLSPDIGVSPIVLEVFPSPDDDVKALRMLRQASMSAQNTEENSKIEKGVKARIKHFLRGR